MVSHCSDLSSLKSSSQDCFSGVHDLKQRVGSFSFKPTLDECNLQKAA